MLPYGEGRVYTSCVFSIFNALHWSLISLTHHCYDWHLGSRCGWTCNQPISKVDGGITGSRLAQVVISHLVCDPTIWQPGFDLSLQQWSLLNHFRIEQGYRGACRRKWRLVDTDLCPCGETEIMSTLSNPVLWQSWMAAYPSCTLQMKMPFPGWPVMVHDMHTRRRRMHCSPCRSTSAGLFIIPMLCAAAFTQF